ncbi:MAG: recombinase RecA [Candidatus Limiplasma sp.]|nr:recombinase RecA [Candidatus Limiplasma sp.]
MAAKKDAPKKTIGTANVDKNDEVTLKQEKLKALESALSQLNKTYGKGAVMKFSDAAAIQNLQVITTGNLQLDLALGVGGLPRGRVVEIFGPESSGKTTVALHCVAEAQKAGGVAAFIDAEHALDPSYAKKLGVDIDNLYISQPDNGEQALEICEALVRSGAVDIVVVDSVAALVPKAEIEGEMGDSFVGLQARLMSQALRKLTGVISKTNAVAIFINQLREKVGVMYGNPETTTGGRALKFYATIRLDVRRGEQLKNGTEVIGNRTKVKVVKNKVAPPFRVAEFDIIYGEGISKDGTLLDMAVDRDIIHKSGAWFSYEDQRIGQGRENARQYLKDNPDVAAKIDKIIREEAMRDMATRKAGSPSEVAEEEPAEADRQTAEEDPDLALLDE